MDTLFSSEESKSYASFSLEFNYFYDDEVDLPLRFPRVNPRLLVAFILFKPPGDVGRGDVGPADGIVGEVAELLLDVDEDEEEETDRLRVSSARMSERETLR